jgi:predicted ATPase
MAKDKDTSGEHTRVEELSLSVALLTQSMTHMTNSVNCMVTKMDTVLEQLNEGVGRFKDIEHKQDITDLRVKAIEAAHAQTASTKQSILMMFLDKGIGVILPWAAITYMVWGKGAP